VADLIAYAFVGVSFSDAKFMGGELFKLIMRFIKVYTSQFTGICSIIYRPKDLKPDANLYCSS